MPFTAMDHTLGTLAAASGAMAIFVGGARAHWADSRLPRDRLVMLEVGMRYQLSHALAAIFCALLVGTTDAVSARVAGWLFLGGTVVFITAMYGYALTGAVPLRRLSPVGGGLFVAGWVSLAAAWAST